MALFLHYITGIQITQIISLPKITNQVKPTEIHRFSNSFQSGFFFFDFPHTF